MADETTITTGIDPSADAPVDAECFAFVDDGEYSTVWAIDRLNDSNLVSVRTFRCEAGRIEADGEERYFLIGERETLQQWGKRYADAHTESVDVARAFFARQ